MKRTMHAQHMAPVASAARPCAFGTRGYVWSKSRTSVEQFGNSLGMDNTITAPARWLMKQTT